MLKVLRINSTMTNCKNKYLCNFKKHTVKKFTLILIYLNFNSCVSQILKEPKPKLSSEIEYAPLPSNYLELKNYFYPAWKNKKTKTVISVISDCQENHPDEKSIHFLLADSFDKSTVVEENWRPLKNNKYYYKSLDAELNSEQLNSMSYSIIKNNCVYLFTISGKKENLIKERLDFETFIITSRIEN